MCGQQFIQKYLPTKLIYFENFSPLCKLPFALSGCTKPGDALYFKLFHRIHESPVQGFGFYAV